MLDAITSFWWTVFIGFAPVITATIISPLAMNGDAAQSISCKLSEATETPHQRRRRLERERWHHNKALQTPAFLKKKIWKRDYDKQYRVEHAQRKAQTDRAWGQRNKERRRLTNKLWREKHPDRVKAYSKRCVRRYKARHPEKVKEILANWKAKNPHHSIHYAGLRRARMAKVDVDPKAVQEYLTRLKLKKSVRCYYCGNRIPSENVHVDHVIALARDGRHHPDNFCVSCAGCNMSKHAKPIGEWQPNTSQQILPL